MRTVAIALPYMLSPEHSSEFADWCADNGIEAEFTRLHADTEYDADWEACYYMVWTVKADDAGLVHLKLRWNDQFPKDDWMMSELERSVAELLFYDVGDKMVSW